MSRPLVTLTTQLALAASETRTARRVRPCTHDTIDDRGRTGSVAFPDVEHPKKTSTRAPGSNHTRPPSHLHTDTTTNHKPSSRHATRQQYRPQENPVTPNARRARTYPDRLYQTSWGSRKHVIIDSDDSDDCQAPVQIEKKAQRHEPRNGDVRVSNKQSQKARPKHCSTKLPANKSEDLTLVAALPFANTNIKDLAVRVGNQRQSNRRGSPTTVSKVEVHDQRYEKTHSNYNQTKSTAGVRNRAKSRNIRQTSAFLNILPGEVRNRIYEYVIPSARIMLFATSPKAEIAEAQKLWQNEGTHLKQPRSRLYYALDREQLKSGTALSTVLMLVSRRVSQEVQYFLYSRTTFCFPSLNVACKFFREASVQGIKSIKNIELDSGTYGEPYLTKDSIFKARFDRKWQTVCTKLGTQLTSLATLKIYTHSVDWPLGDIAQTEWHKSLMNITQHRQLEDVEIHLTNPWFRLPKIAKLRRKIEESMMTSRGKEIREDKEHQRDLMLIREAELKQLSAARPVVKCLRITLSPQQGESPKEREQD